MRFDLNLRQRWNDLRIRVAQWRRSLTAAGSPRNPSYWLQSVFGGRQSSTGIRVNEQTALSWTALWAGVRFLSETIAALPLDVIEQTGKVRKTIEDHPLLKLYRNGPNEEQTWFEFVEMMMAQVLLFGTAYAQIIRDGRGNVVELWPLHFDRVTVERDRDGKVVYRISIPTSLKPYITKPPLLQYDDVLILRGFTVNGLLGERLADLFAEAIGLGLATEEYIAKFFGQGANASGFLSHPGKLSKEAHDRLRESVNQQIGGMSNAHRYLILEEAMAWHQLSVDPEKAQALGLRKFQISEAARILRISPHHLGDLDRATFSNIEHMGIETVVYSLTPWVIRWEQRMRKQLISDKMRGTVYVKLKVAGLLRGDLTAQKEWFMAGRQGGWFSVNDIRELLDMNPVAGGNMYLQPVNMQELGTPPAPVKPPTPPPTDDNAEDDDQQEAA